MNNKTKTTVVFIFAILFVPNIMNSSFAQESESTQSEKAKDVYDILSPKALSDAQNYENSQNSQSLLTLVNTAANSINWISASGIDDTITIGIDASRYNDSLESFNATMYETYPDVDFKIGYSRATLDSCTYTKDSTCSPRYGGMRLFLDGTEETEVFMSTIAMGVETNDGDKGTLLSGHTNGWGNIDAIVMSDVTDAEGSNSAFASGINHGEIILNPEKTTGNIVECDCAFANFTQTDATYGTDGVEITAAFQNETVELYKIWNSSSTTLDVTGTHTAVANEVLNGTGMMSGHQIFTIESTDVTVIEYVDKNDSSTIFGVSAITDVPVTNFSDLVFTDGDSGAPLYTKADDNGEVKIVGMYVGRQELTVPGESTTYRHYFVDWDSIQVKLDLKNPS